MNHYKNLPLRQKERIRAELYTIAARYCKEGGVYTTQRGYWWTARDYIEKATLRLAKHNPAVKFPPEQSGLEIMICLENPQEKKVSLEKYLKLNEISAHVLKGI